MPHHLGSCLYTTEIESNEHSRKGTYCPGWKDRGTGLENKQELWKTRQSCDHEVMPQGHAKDPVAGFSKCHPWAARYLVTLPCWTLDSRAAIPLESLNAPALYAAPCCSSAFGTTGGRFRLAEPKIQAWPGVRGKGILPLASNPGARARPDTEQTGKIDTHHICIGCLWLLFLSFHFYSLFLPLL